MVLTCQTLQFVVSRALLSRHARRCDQFAQHVRQGLLGAPFLDMGQAVQSDPNDRTRAPPQVAFATPRSGKRAGRPPVPTVVSPTEPSHVLGRLIRAKLLACYPVIILPRSAECATNSKGADVGPHRSSGTIRSVAPRTTAILQPRRRPARSPRLISPTRLARYFPGPMVANDSASASVVNHTKPCAMLTGVIRTQRKPKSAQTWTPSHRSSALNPLAQPTMPTEVRTVAASSRQRSIASARSARDTRPKPPEALRPRVVR